MDHFIGTASCMLHANASIDSVVVGLSHGIYTHFWFNDFIDGAFELYPDVKSLMKKQSELFESRKDPIIAGHLKMEYVRLGQILFPKHLRRARISIGYFQIYLGMAHCPSNPCYGIIF